MHYRGTIVALLLAGTLSASAGSFFTVTVETERTGSATSYASTTSRSRMTSLTTISVRYRFKIRAAAMAPGSATLEWVVLAAPTQGEDPQECARGENSLQFTKNVRSTVVETGPIGVPADDRTVVRSGSFNTSHYGYGIRITDAQGRVLEEKYSPAGAKRAINWRALAGAATAPTTTTRRAVPQPQVF